MWSRARSTDPPLSFFKPAFHKSERERANFEHHAREHRCSVRSTDQLFPSLRRAETKVQIAMMFQTVCHACEERRSCSRSIDLHLSRQERARFEQPCMMCKTFGRAGKETLTLFSGRTSSTTIETAVTYPTMCRAHEHYRPRSLVLQTAVVSIGERERAKCQ